jgi:hypothetical protein
MKRIIYDFSKEKLYIVMKRIIYDFYNVYNFYTS